FSYYLPLMSREDLDTYLFHRLAIAGFTTGVIFAEKARDTLYRASRGVPRVVNILCHKALLVAYGRGEAKVTNKIMQSAIMDTEFAKASNKKWLTIGVLFSFFVFMVLLLYKIQGII
ncbi:MAG TPA: AAA family ATPase, partial [Gammaproteobacteria bacterium]|nr:AAA family ATPase [Gammaproteobacteria bacterium]